MNVTRAMYSLARPLTPGEACRIAGVSYRQVQYWDKTGLVKPLWIKKFRSYPFCTVLFLVAVALLRKKKNSIQSVRMIIDSLEHAIEKLDFPLEESVLLIGPKRFYISHGDVYASNEDLIQIDCRKLFSRFAAHDSDMASDDEISVLDSAVA